MACLLKTDTLRQIQAMGGKRQERLIKVFDSGMPEENYWNSLFNTILILDWLKLDRITLPVVEIGCGYGTFTIPLANRIKPNRVITFAIDEKMIENTNSNVRDNKVDNVDAILRDIIEDGTGILDNSSVSALIPINGDIIGKMPKL